MFVNGDAIGVAIKLLTAGLMLLCLALTSHVVWISSLVRSRALDRFGTVGRIALLALAAATPVGSFYCVSIVRHRRRHPLQLNPAGTGRIMLGTVGAFTTVVLVLLAVEQLHQPALDPYGPNGFLRLPGMILALAVPCAVLGMACQAWFDPTGRAGLIVVAGSTAACLFLLA